MLARYGAPILTQTFHEEGNFRVELWVWVHEAADAERLNGRGYGQTMT